MTELYHDTDRNLLVYRTDPDPVVRVFPDARKINGAYVTVPFNLNNLQLLRRMDLPVPPVMASYDWPCAPGIKPYESQKITSNFLVMHPHCYNFSDMGVGKTLSTLWAADWLMSQYPKGTFRALVVCPL